MAEMKWYEEGKPVFVMVAINFFLAIVNILLKKVLDEGMNNLVIITYRQCLATSFLAPIAYFWERKSRPKLTSRILCHIFLGAIVGPTLTQYFFLLGIQYTSATFSCAFINVVPVLTFLMALPFGLETVNLKSKAGRAKLLGTVVCVGGAMMLTLYKGLPLTNRPSSQASTQMTNQASSRFSPQKRAERWTIGTIALVAGSIFWSSWFLIQARISKQYPCQYSSTAIMSFFSAIQSAVLSLVIERDISLWVLRGKAAILTVLYAGIMGSGLSFVGMSWCVKKRGPLFTSAFSPLIQIIVAIIDFFILHEQLNLGSVLGSVLVIIGLYILLWGKSKEAQSCMIKPQAVEEEEAHQEAPV
ncbi:PREDICTED: WAT1-related protein At3g30340-like isoform X3 [Nelumbo nucifera]|uniref:WAT1-related protein n=1 Tax=Nelumbo nucifera TaxID=4432 RepID=A0A1U7Z2Q1_NELNU|nr:PREDICTED: WAT1-related protein At3g30340-like isoform X3 [Nelumbo nucifera]